jgi:hypothetical protein
MFYQQGIPSWGSAAQVGIRHQMWGDIAPHSGVPLNSVLQAPRAPRKNSDKKGGKAMADIDDLKAAFEQVVATVNARNLDAFSELLHHDMVSLPSSFLPFPLEGKAARRQMFQMNSATNESVT